MNIPENLYEDREDSCRSLDYFISISSDESQKKVLLSDFICKSLGIRHEARLYFMSRILLHFVPSNIATIIGGPVKSILPPKPKADIAIVTIKKPELLAAKIALGINPDQRESYRDNDKGYRYFEQRVPCNGSNTELIVVLTMVGEERNVPCTNACRTLFNNYDVGACILTGIAAGSKKKFRLADVVAAESVWDYEGARLEESGRKNRPGIMNLSKQIKLDLEHYSAGKAWKELFRKCFGELAKIQEVPDVMESWVPSYHTGVILSGEKLLADGSLEELTNSSHERANTLEMEASGFAQACDECDIPWLIFRGISDFGDRETKDGVSGDTKSRKIWQTPAALAAATIVIDFLKNDYRTKTELVF